MTNIIEKLAFYRLRHRNIWNRALHFVAIPTLVFSILVPMALIRFRVDSLEISLAMVFVCLVLAYYLLLDVCLATGAVILNAPLLFLAEFIVGSFDLTTALTLFPITFIFGGALQLIGHRIEGKRPAFMENLVQVFIAPIFVVTELFFVLNLRKGLKAKVESFEGSLMRRG